MMCFNPLHCGAVVASRSQAPCGSETPPPFQSPSLRGSGRFGGGDVAAGAPGAFQSPSLRGSGRFCARASASWRARACFNPLHCGAVVASFRSAVVNRWRRVWFQSPSLRGSGRFPERRAAERRAARFNPLHCGAVVASHVPGRTMGSIPRGVSIPFIAGQWSLPG